MFKILILNFFVTLYFLDLSYQTNSEDGIHLEAGSVFTFKVTAINANAHSEASDLAEIRLKGGEIIDNFDFIKNSKVYRRPDKKKLERKAARKRKKERKKLRKNNPFLNNQIEDFHSQQIISHSKELFRLVNKNNDVRLEEFLSNSQFSPKFFVNHLNKWGKNAFLIATQKGIFIIIILLYLYFLISLFYIFFLFYIYIYYFFYYHYFIFILYFIF